MRSFINKRKSRVYKFRCVEAIGGVETGTFDVEIFTCVLCDHEIQVPVCIHPFHYRCPLIGYTWLETSYQGAMLESYSIQESFERMRKRFKKWLKRQKRKARLRKDQEFKEPLFILDACSERSLWFDVMGTLTGNFVIPSPSPDLAAKLKHGTRVCGSCLDDLKGKNVLVHLWTH